MEQYYRDFDPNLIDRPSNKSAMKKQDWFVDIKPADTKALLKKPLVATIEGYASIFGEADLNGDIVTRGAFSRSLAKTPPSNIRMLYQHAAETPLGRWLYMEEDEIGLYVIGELFLDAPTANEVYTMISGGALDGFSIGYRVIEAEKFRKGGRKIKRADLWEISIVTFPMAPRARITHVSKPQITSRSVQQDDTDTMRAFAGAVRGAAAILTV